MFRYHLNFVWFVFDLRDQGLFKNLNTQLLRSIGQSQHVFQRVQMRRIPINKAAVICISVTKSTPLGNTQRLDMRRAVCLMQEISILTHLIPKSWGVPQICNTWR